MSVPRRRIIRPPSSVLPENAEKIQRIRARLEREHLVFARWLSKLKRAFNVIQKTQQNIKRLERQLGQIENGVTLQDRNGAL